jgi:hypothetical protein
MTHMTPIILLFISIAVLAGCSHDTRAVPDTYSAAELYKDYRKHDRGYPMSIHDAGAVLARSDLKSTGDYPPTDLTSVGGRVRFIYGRKYYWAYHTNPWNAHDEPQMYGPFDLP